MLAGLADHRLLIREAAEDRLHQDYRSPLFPEAPQLLAGLLAGGALAACWSGAGPTLLGICVDGRRGRVRRPPWRPWAQPGPRTVLVLRADLPGLVSGDGRPCLALGAAPPPRLQPRSRGVPAPTGAGLFDFDAQGCAPFGPDPGAPTLGWPASS